MKRILPILALAVLAACGGGNVQAQTIDSSFKTQLGDIVNLDNASSVGRSGIYFVIKTGSTSQMVVADNNADLYNKVTADAWFQANYVRALPTMNWYRISKIAQVRCEGGKTMFYMFDNVAPGLANDNCAAFYQLQARAK